MKKSGCLYDVIDTSGLLRYQNMLFTIITERSDGVMTTLLRTKEV